jgi:TP901 family phage tail tape measure protein
MAGFLGTLFMGNVGLRLLLPPKAAYTKMAGDFGRGAKKISQMGLQESKKRNKQEETELRKRLLTAQLLSRRANETNANEDIQALQKELQQMDTLLGGKLKKIGKSIGSDIYQGARTQGKKSLGEYQEVLGVLDEQGFPGIDSYFDKLEAKIKNIVAGALQMFNQAVSVSVMGLTTLGFQVQTVARSLIEYENELVNANSIFQVSNDELYQISNEVIDTGLNYALTYDNMSQALYQFASAGLSAAESQQILADVMKLSMAVQGDSETLGKLMIQVMKGYNMEFDEASKLADQFAYTINKSLIEWQDLAAAVKFAMPFFAATNQEVEQLFGGLAILTDRSLEAGIAGRGLRQGIAELAESLGENTRKFQEMGIAITDAEGNMLQLTEIAMNFNEHFGEAANDTELLTTLIEDLNVRGATAFVHLIQNAEEYAQVTEEIANASGTATEMADKQMESLSNQIIITKNAIMAAFLYGEVQEDGTMGANAFHQSLLDIVTMVREKFVTTLDDGTNVLTKFGFQLRDIAIRFVEKLNDLLSELIDWVASLASEGVNLTRVLDYLFFPLELIVGLMSILPESTRGTAFEFFMLSKMIGGTAAAYVMLGTAIVDWTYKMVDGNKELMKTVGLIEIIAGAVLLVIGVVGPLAMIMSGIGMMIAAGWTGAGAVAGAGLIAAGVVSLASGVGVKAGLGLMGVGVATFGGGSGDYSPAESGVSGAYDSYLESVEGGSFSEQYASAGGATTLNVDTANFRTDNLDETFYASQVAV